jgi:hypothetical protein
MCMMVDLSYEGYSVLWTIVTDKTNFFSQFYVCFTKRYTKNKLIHTDVVLLLMMCCIFSVVCNVFPWNDSDTFSNHILAILYL